MLRLIQDAIDRLGLDLRGLVVLTEVGSGNYMFTPAIAALAGAARTIAVCRDSPYGRADEVIASAERWAATAGVEFEAVAELGTDHIAAADIVTNLGFVRPIDRAFVRQMKRGAVIPSMSDAWEFRRGDVDLNACRKHNIPVMGTFEQHPNLRVFDFCGQLLLKQLFELGLEVRGNRFLILSSDPFGPTLLECLSAIGADAFLARSGREVSLTKLDKLDAVIAADLKSRDAIIGPLGWLDIQMLESNAPEAVVVQFAGLVDVPAILKAGLRCVPDRQIGKHRMARTLADLGPKPVIDLHAGGFKVGELCWRTMKELGDATETVRRLGSLGSIAQPVEMPMAVTP